MWACLQPNQSIHTCWFSNLQGQSRSMHDIGTGRKREDCRTLLPYTVIVMQKSANDVYITAFQGSKQMKSSKEKRTSSHSIWGLLTVRTNPRFHIYTRHAWHQGERNMSSLTGSVCPLVAGLPCTLGLSPTAKQPRSWCTARAETGIAHDHQTRPSRTFHTTRDGDVP
jgi:hypothetical protein